MLEKVITEFYQGSIIAFQRYTFEILSGTIGKTARGAAPMSARSIRPHSTVTTTPRADGTRAQGVSLRELSMGAFTSLISRNHPCSEIERIRLHVLRRLRSFELSDNDQ